MNSTTGLNHELGGVVWDTKRDALQRDVRQEVRVENIADDAAVAGGPHGTVAKEPLAGELG